jgi:hypothetical protein
MTLGGFISNIKMGRVFPGTQNCRFLFFAKNNCTIEYTNSPTAVAEMKYETGCFSFTP